jgi:hypothetical protein
MLVGDALYGSMGMGTCSRLYQSKILVHDRFELMNRNKGTKVNVYGRPKNVTQKVAFSPFMPLAHSIPPDKIHTHGLEQFHRLTNGLAGVVQSI